MINNPKIKELIQKIGNSTAVIHQGADYYAKCEHILSGRGNFDAKEYPGVVLQHQGYPEDGWEAVENGDVADDIRYLVEPLEQMIIELVQEVLTDQIEPLIEDSHAKDAIRQEMQSFVNSLGEQLEFHSLFHNVEDKDLINLTFPAYEKPKSD